MVSEQRSPERGLDIGNSIQELLSRRGRRNWRAVAALLLVGALVFALIVTGAVLLASRRHEEHRLPDAAPLRSLDLDDFIKGRGTPEDFNATWISDNEFLYLTAERNVLIYNVISKKADLLCSNSLIPESVFKVELSADRLYLLAVYNYNKLFRYTYIAHYDIIDLTTQKKRSIVNSQGLQDNNYLQLVVWSPKENGLAYVFHNDIYYRPNAAKDTEIRLTSTGSQEAIYNGVPDWVYEEEVLSSNKALWFSPDGEQLAYATFNDSLTRVIAIPFYGAPNNLEFQYPRSINLRYPKPGSPNPIVTLSVINLGDATISPVEIPPPVSLQLQEPILSAVTWSKFNEICAIWMNRVQNQAEIVTCNPTTGICQNLLSENEPKGWFDLFVPPLFSDSGEKLLIIFPHKQTELADSFRHVTLIDRSSTPPKISALTSGKYVVTEILSWDEEKHLIFFTATDPENPAFLHVYSIHDNPTETDSKQCMSCSVKTERGNKKCLYNKATFSTDRSYYVLSCLGPDIPEISIFDMKHGKIRVWDSNEELRQLLANKNLPVQRQLEVEVPGGYKAQVNLWLPPNLDKMKKYPLLVNVYGGPDSYQVTKRFNIDWYTYLTVNRSIIYAAIDGRGSGLKGNNMLFAGYRQLGTVEIEDQINVTRFLQDKFSYIDRKHTGIWGWSYGGYSTGMALVKDDSNVFKCGISVAPVTNWMYYDTIYTERYMGLPIPSDNLKGYKDSDLTSKVDKLRNKMFFLIHGTLDDNVHYQQSMMLSRSLEQNDILFRQQSYPDEEHSLGGVRPHLYHTLEEFLEECFHLERK